MNKLFVRVRLSTDLIYKVWALIVLVIFVNSEVRAQNTFLDSSFAGAGIAYYSPPSGSGIFHGIAVQPDQKVIAAGTGQGGVLVIRYNPDGTLDNSFASGGIYSVLYNGGVSAVVLQQDGKIITVGYPHRRFNGDGTLDNTFGVNGLDTVNAFSSHTFGAQAIALQPDGKIVLAGAVNGYGLGIVRLKPDGKRDSTFGVEGLVTTTDWPVWAYGRAEAVAVLPDGKIVAGGLTSLNQFMAVRVLANGDRDTSFNHTGVVSGGVGTSYNYCHGMVVQADGKIILGGGGAFSGQGGNYALIRYNMDGTLDRNYGDTGIVSIDFEGEDDEIWAMCKGSNGSVIATGYSIVNTTEHFSLARIDSTGHLDNLFGNNGRIISAIPDSHSRAQCIAVQQDGKVLVGGFVANGTGGGNAVLVRYGKNATSVSQVKKNLEGIILCPNPARDKLIISGNDARHITSIIAYDVTGRKLAISCEAESNEINLTRVKCGLYVFIISFDNRSPITQRVQINNPDSWN